MSRRIGLFFAEAVGIALMLFLLWLLNALPDHSFIAVLVILFLSIAELGRKLSEIDNKLTTLAKKLNISLEDAPPKEKKRIIVSD